MTKRFISWNVNGIRAAQRKGFEEQFAQLDADIFAIQETKCQAGQVKLDVLNHHSFWSSAEKKGYSGTAIFSKEKPLQELYKLGIDTLDLEGRIVALEYPKFWFVCTYTPNAQDGLKRIDHRLAWDDAYRQFCKNLEDGILPGGKKSTPKPLVMCGDFNVAHHEIDLKNPGPNKGNAGFSDEERSSFSKLVDAGFVDTFRLLHPHETDRYSWWSYRAAARARNVGWRIDYFLVSKQLASSVIDADIYDSVMGSDHCPIGLCLDI